MQACADIKEFGFKRYKNHLSELYAIVLHVYVCLNYYLKY